MPSLARKPSYIQFTPKRPMSSFENLVALANYEERINEARKIVWRDRGELPVEIQDLWECLEHASRGGMRSATLAFSIRSGINLLLVLTRIGRVRKEQRFALIRHALFGQDSFRFAGMLGSFVFIYKYLLNALPLLVPPKLDEDTPFDSDDDEIEIVPASRPLSRKARLSSGAYARQVFLKQKSRPWFAPLAGAIAGGISIMFEKNSRRIAIGQQMFVRGLQGSYNAFSAKHNFKIPHGDIIIFSLACGQIMYAFMMRPDTIPHSYNTWIGNAAKVPPEIVSMTRTLVREGRFKMSDMDALLALPNIHPVNLATLMDRKARALQPIPDFGNPGGPCEGVHPNLVSCFLVPPTTFWEVFKWMVPVYGALHFIPMLLFKRGRVLKEPMKMLIRAAWGTTRSSAFLGVFVIMYKMMLCSKHNLYAYLNPKKIIPQPLVDALVSKGSFWIIGAITGLSLFVEDKKRRAELAMYVLPKGLESAWVGARGKGYVGHTGQVGEAAMAAVGMGMVMRAYQNDPQHLSGLIRRIIYQFVGPN